MVNPEIFVSYKREDEKLALKLVKALEKSGFSVWWDRSLVPASSWQTQIQEALENTKCVIVLWTRESTGPQGDFVRSEARYAKDKNILIPIMMQRTRPPLGFDEIEYIDLVGWRGGQNSVFFQDLVAACRAKIEGREKPTPHGPLSRITKRLRYVGVTTALAGLAAFLANVASIQNQVCSISLLQPSLADACGAVDLGGKPTRRERLAWVALPKEDCEALRNYVRKFPDSPQSDNADRLASFPRITKSERWEAATIETPLSVGLSEQNFSTELEAQSNARKRAQILADQRCLGLGASDSTYKYISAKTDSETFECLEYYSGHSCRLSGKAKCQMQVRKLEVTETCGYDPE